METDMIFCGQVVLHKEIKMEKPMRRSVILDAIDEKIELLGQRNFFVIGSEIDQSTLGGLFANLFTRLMPENKKPLWVMLDSPGGSFHQGLAVYDLLRAIALQGWDVNIISIGQVASMAVCILQAGTKRYAFSNTQFTVHQASLSGDGDPQEVNRLMENAKELERLNETVLKIVAERSGMDLQELLKISKKTDYSMDADTAKRFGKHGLIDEVITTFPFPINS